MPGQDQEANRRNRKRSLKNERGVALLEFALVLPLLMLLLVGLMEFGKAFTMWIDETHLANRAARHAAVNRAPSGATVESNVTAFEDAIEADGDTKELRDSFALPGNGVNVCFPSGTGAVGDSIRVDVKATKNFLGFLSGFVPSLAGAKSLTAHSVMRIEATGAAAYSPAFAAHPDQACP